MRISKFFVFCAKVLKEKKYSKSLLRINSLSTYIGVQRVFLEIPEHLVWAVMRETVGAVGLRVDTDGVGDLWVVDEALVQHLLSPPVKTS